MKKYSNEQLSRVLSEHAEGNLDCINQVAYIMSNIFESGFIRPKLIAKFDAEYDTFWTVDKFLAKLEEWGA